MRRFSVSVGRLVVLVALGCLMLAGQAQAYTAGPPSPALICDGAVMANQQVLEASLSPANGATVFTGSPVTFSGHSGAPVTFAVASSEALLSSPDLDSGLGSEQPERAYSFSSLNAGAISRTVYWDASFSSATLQGCEGLTPTTYTTSVRTLTVVPAPPTEAEVAAKRRQEEEVAAKKEREEESIRPATGNVSLDAATLDVQGSIAAAKLTCTGTATCSGKLTLTVKTAGQGRKKRAKVRTIGTAGFSIPAGETTTVKFELSSTARALLRANHGILSAVLTLLKSSPAPAQTHTANVRIAQRKLVDAKRS